MINKFSFLLAALLLFAMTGQEAWRMQRGTRPARMAVWAVLVTLVIGGWWVGFRPEPSKAIGSVADFEAVLDSGQPVLLEVYSEYWLSCLAQEPLVDRLAKNLGDSATVLRVSIHAEIGREISARYGFKIVPTFVIFDKDGNETWRGGLIPSREKVLGLE